MPVIALWLKIHKCQHMLKKWAPWAILFVNYLWYFRVYLLKRMLSLLMSSFLVASGNAHLYKNHMEKMWLPQLCFPARRARVLCTQGLLTTHRVPQCSGARKDFQKKNGRQRFNGSSSETKRDVVMCPKAKLIVTHRTTNANIGLPRKKSLFGQMRQ